MNHRHFPPNMRASDTQDLNTALQMIAVTGSHGQQHRGEEWCVCVAIPLCPLVITPSWWHFYAHPGPAELGRLAGRALDSSVGDPLLTLKLVGLAGQSSQAQVVPVQFVAPDTIVPSITCTEEREARALLSVRLRSQRWMESCTSTLSCLVTVILS